MESMEALIGQTLGQYTVIEQIGEGGMATVFKAYQPSLERDIALKVLPPSFAKKGDFSERFSREAKAIANLHHPNILPVYDSGQHKGYSYIAMRYIKDAVTLADRMKQPLKPNRIVDLITQIAAALDHAHQAGIIHRDIKPSNILMDGDWPLLSDFGLAKMVENAVDLTGTGVGMGTPSYMSPEQGMGKKVDHRTDIYALGIILFEMLTKQIPHKAETPIATVMKRINDPLPLPRSINPDIPEAVERVILKALAVDPTLRFNSAGEMAQTLKAAYGNQADEILSEVSKTYVEPPSKTVAPAGTGAAASGGAGQSGRNLALPINIFGFGTIALLVGAVLCGVGVLIVFQLWPDRSPVTWQYVIDLSDGMNAAFPGEDISKWEAAQATLADDLGTVPDDINVGLRVFGQGVGDAACTETELLVEPNPNRAAQIQNKLVSLSPSGAESPLTEAIVQSFNDLELDPDKRNALVILTTGQDSCDPEGVEQVTTVFQRLNVKVDTYVVGLAVDDPAAEQNLQTLASAGDGVYLTANTSNQLEDVLQLIQENLEAENDPQEIAQAPTPTPTFTPTPAPTDTPAPTATPTEAVAVALNAQDAYDLAIEQAQAWQPDVVLSEIQTTFIDLLDEEGTSESWSFSFYSPSTGELQTFLLQNGAIQPTTPVPLPQQPNLVAFDDSVILDTKRIFDIAAAAGGAGIMAEGYEPSAALTQYPLDETIPTWYVNYMNPDTAEVVFTVIIEARSGDVMQALDLR
ncbi:MAG: protein kinase [Anaerolineae bacterium]|nr:protein kinase [Anaerolineae bacterium]